MNVKLISYKKIAALLVNSLMCIYVYNCAHSKLYTENCFQLLCITTTLSTDAFETYFSKKYEKVKYSINTSNERFKMIPNSLVLNYIFTTGVFTTHT